MIRVPNRTGSPFAIPAVQALALTSILTLAVADHEPSEWLTLGMVKTQIDGSASSSVALISRRANKPDL